MHDAISTMQAYELTRWVCSRCGIFERGTRTGTAPLLVCPSCGQPAGLQVTVRGMTVRLLPFCTAVRLELDPDSRYSDMSSDNRRAHHTQRKVRRANGRSTGRPRKIVALPATVIVPGKGEYELVKAGDDD